MATYKALVWVKDIKSFIESAFNTRSGYFKTATKIEGYLPSWSMPDGIIIIQSEDRLNVEDVLINDCGMEIEDVSLSILKY
jgi:hypothetical protein